MMQADLESLPVCVIWIFKFSKIIENYLKTRLR